MRSTQEITAAIKAWETANPALYQQAMKAGGPGGVATATIAAGVLTPQEVEAQGFKVTAQGTAIDPNDTSLRMNDAEGKIIKGLAIAGMSALGGAAVAGAVGGGAAGATAGKVAGTAIAGGLSKASGGGVSPLASALIAGGSGAANADLTQEKLALDAYGANTSAQSAFQTEQQSARTSALKNLALQSYVSNPRSSPFDPKGNPTYSPQFTSTLQTLANQGSDVLSKPAVQPTYTPLPTNAGDLQNTPSTASTIATLAGLGLSAFGKPATAPTSTAAMPPPTPATAPQYPWVTPGAQNSPIEDALTSGDSQNYYD